MKWSIFFINIIIHVGIMALFLTVFFFTIAQYFEKKIIEDQIYFVIDDFVGNSLKPVPKTTKDEIKHEINSEFDKQDLSKADESIRKEKPQVRWRIDFSNSKSLKYLPIPPLSVKVTGSSLR